MMAVASGVWAEAVQLEKAWELTEVSPGDDGKKKTMKEELERIGFLGATKASYKNNPFAAHFELHIEQGPILEKERRKVGIVQGGTTPFSARMDPTLCAAKLIVQSNAIAKEMSGLATTGIIHTIPGSVNTMAHTVNFTLDIRHTSDQRLAELKDRCRADFSHIASNESEHGCTVEWKDLVDSPTVRFHKDCISAVRSSARESLRDLSVTSEDGVMWKDMISGAGHDSCYTNQRCPTSMIFVPTKEGISHNPQEYCSPEDW
jgi:acetylornithine deacetylase/succinyl-diaminopimelate desuccinylase-like protein